MKQFLKRHWPVFVLFAVLTILYFRKFFFDGLLPIPSDIVTGVYYPWRDYSWGYSVAVPVKNALPSDIVSFIYPFRILAIDMLKDGQFPLWNPYVLSGTPLFANFQTALLYPTTLLYFIFSKAMAWSLGIVLQTLLSLSFMYLFLYDLLKSRLASALGAIVFAFSAFATVWLEYNTHGHTAYWLPVQLFFINRYLKSAKIFWLLLIAVSMALQTLAGYPQLILYSLFIVLSYIAFHFYQQRDEQFIRHYVFIAAALGFGLLLASVQLIPGYEFLQMSNRFVDQTVQASNGGFLPWRNLITFLIPDFFGNPTTLNFWGLGFYDNFAGYAGVVTIIFALQALYYRDKKLTYYFCLLLLISLLLSLRTPVSQVLAHFNVLGFKAAVASRALFITDFSLSVLTAIGFSWFISQKYVSYKILLRPILYVCVILGSVCGSIFAIYLLFRQYQIASELPLLLVILRNSAIPIGFFCIVGILLIMYLRFTKLRQTIQVVIVILVVVDLFRFGDKYLSFTPKNLLFPSTPAIDFVKENAGYNRINGGDAMPMNFWVPYGLYAANGYDANYMLRYGQFLNIIKGSNGTQALGRYGEIVDYNSQLFDLLGISYVFALKWTPEEEVRPHGVVRPQFRSEKFQQIFGDKSVAVLQNTQVFPRVFLVNNYHVGQSNNEIARLLQDKTLDLKQTAILESELNNPLRGSTGSASIVKYHPNSVRIQATTNGDMLLFLSDTYAPGWHAYVDGVRTTIYRANFVFRSVVVPTGSHTVEFRYQPTSFKAGALLSIISATIGVMLGLYIVVLKRGRKI